MSDRSTEPRGRGSGWLVILATLTVLSLVGVLAALVARTTVPYPLEGVVTAVTERNRSPGTEFWVIELADGRRWFVDEEAARSIRPGTIHKQAWSRHVRIGTEVSSIGWSRDLLGPAIWATATTVATIAALVGHHGRVRAGGPPS